MTQELSPRGHASERWPKRRQVDTHEVLHRMLRVRHGETSIRGDVVDVATAECKPGTRDEQRAGAKRPMRSVDMRVDRAVLHETDRNPSRDGLAAELLALVTDDAAPYACRVDA